VNKDRDHLLPFVEDNGLVEGEDATGSEDEKRRETGIPPSKRSIRAKKNNLKERRALWKDPEVEQESTIGPVAEVVEEIVLLLCSEI
jgi:hypothetical protein